MQCAALTVHVSQGNAHGCLLPQSVLDRHPRQPASAHDFLQQAPEVLMGGRCSEKVDIFSLGVVLWELVTGESPARGRLRPVKCTPILWLPPARVAPAAARCACTVSVFAIVHVLECSVAICQTSVSSEASTGPANCRTPEGQLPPTNPAKNQRSQFPPHVQGAGGVQRGGGGPQSGMRDVATLALTIQFHSILLRRVPGECSEAVADLIAACMEAQPADRPSARDVVDMLSQQAERPLAAGNRRARKQEVCGTTILMRMLCPQHCGHAQPAGRAAARRRQPPRPQAGGGRTI